ncbi:MAG: hypothetical protein AB2689_21720 [Candidatus Thiodiazotropha taylori]
MALSCLPGDGNPIIALFCLSQCCDAKFSRAVTVLLWPVVVVVFGASVLLMMSESMLDMTEETPLNFFWEHWSIEDSVLDILFQYDPP